MADASLGLRTYGGEATVHSHSHLQIVLPHLGRLEMEVDGRGGMVVPGLGAFIRAGATHSFCAKGANAFIVVDASADEEAEPEIPLPGQSAFFAIPPAVQGLIDYAVGTLSHDGLSRAAEASWSFLLLDSVARIRPVATGHADAALGRALAFLRAHAMNDIQAKDIAAAAGLSESRLRALFRSRLQTSPHAMLTRLRLQEAQHLLATTVLPVAEIALRTGHADQSALTRRLRLAHGITPARFRRTVQDGRSGGLA